MKGMSSLIAAVLVLAMGIIIALIVSTSVQSIALTSTSGVRSRSSDIVNCSSASLEIQAVYLDTNQNNTRTVIRNTGQQRETIQSADIFNTTGGKGSVLSPSLPVSVARGDIANIIFNVSGTNNPTYFNSSLPNVTCASFSQIIISSECVITKYDRKPTNC